MRSSFFGGRIFCGARRLLAEGSQPNRSAAFLLEGVGQLLQIEDFVGRLDTDLEHGLAGPVGPRAFQSLSNCAHDFPEMAGDPEYALFRTTGAVHPEFVYFWRWLECLGLLAVADDFVEVLVCSGVFAVILDHLL